MILDFNTLIYLVLIGWAVNWIVTMISLANDLYWKNLNVAQGFIACAAFSWVPFLVLFAGLKHFVGWILALGEKQNGAY